MQTIYFKCSMGDENKRLIDHEKKQNPIAWSTCERREENRTFKATDYVIMRVGANGEKAYNSMKHVKTQKFFEGLPVQYWQLVDTRDLGASSYTYELSGVFGNMYKHCGVQPNETNRRLEDEDDSDDKFSSLLDVTLVKGSTSEQKVIAWYNQVMEDTGKKNLRRAEAARQVEVMTCRFQDECLGGVPQFTETFKKDFGVKKHDTNPRCKTVLARFKRTKKELALDDWKQRMVKHFGCPKPNQSHPVVGKK